jgi:microcystin-dependent protein
MAQPYVGEIRMFAGNFAPAGWMFCDGSLIPISENETLFNVIGTTYGGDGQQTFALPDLRGRASMHMGTGSDGGTATIGGIAGVESVTLTSQQIPSHTHSMNAAAAASVLSPQNALPAVPSSTVGGLQTYAPTGGTLVTLRPTMVQVSGGSQPHENFQPYLCVSFIISLFGIFPSQT